MTDLFGPCAKRRVQAVLTSPSGEVFVAENVCLNPQPVCPRELGEGYAKCKSICQQVDHAEAQVLRMAGLSGSMGATLRITHHYACDECLARCKRAGVEKIEYLSPVNSERTP